MTHTISDAINRLKRNKNDDIGCALLIGAGCSVTAGIPLAGKFVEIVRDEFSHEYARAVAHGTVDYPGCMGQLTPGDRRKLMGRFLRDARINWAHIHIARLIKAGYVDRVLTTNFDPLLVRACALFNIFPAVYDMAAIRGFEPQRIDGPAIFHLHGTGTGFFQAHDTDEVNELSGKLAPLFRDCLGRARTWIVAGYSAKCDPVVDHLLQVPSFDQNLYWVGYRDEKPSVEIEPLFSHRRAAYWLSGHHADGFFADLADGVGCAPPPFLDKPFSHLETVLRDITGFREEDEKTSDTTLPLFASDALLRIRRAIACIEPNAEWTCDYSGTAANPVAAPSSPAPGTGPSLVEQLKMRMMARDWDAIIAQRDAILASGDGNAISTLVAALNGCGMQAAQRGREAPSKEESLEHFLEAKRHYEDALSFRPDAASIHSNMGNALDSLATLREDHDAEGAEKLRADALQYYERAAAIAPNHAIIVANLAAAFVRAADRVTGEQQKELYEKAISQSQLAISLQPSHADIYRIAAITKINAAIDLQYSSKHELFKQGVLLLDKAIDLAPEDAAIHAAYAGSLLLIHSSDPEAASLNEATKYCERANELTPGAGAYNLACIAAIKGDEIGCREWLLASKSANKLPTRRKLLSDPDLAGMRDKAWFQDFIASL